MWIYFHDNVRIKEKIAIVPPLQPYICNPERRHLEYQAMPSLRDVAHDG
jgi:hypothetical protein